MSYKEFLQYIEEQFAQYLSEEPRWKVLVEERKKNNGTLSECLVIGKEGETSYIGISLQSYYQKFCEGTKLHVIMEEIVCNWELQKIQRTSKKGIQEYEECRHQLFFKLVNIGINNALWENTPYRPWNDLALTVRWLLNQNENGITSILVTDRELEKWNVTWEQVCQDAEENTPKLFPAFITPVQELLKEEEKREQSQEGDKVSLYILTNKKGMNGATCICYENLVSDFALDLQCNLFLLPSSIHEILVLPDDGIYQKEQLFEMVWEANHTVVSQEELLSYQIYYCNYQTGEIELLTKYS